MREKHPAHPCSSPHSIFRPCAGLQISCDVFAAGYPFIEEEVEYCCGEYCRSVKDMLSLRMRLAYINSEAAKEIVPKVAELMGARLGWSGRERARQEAEAMEYVGEVGEVELAIRRGVA